MICRKEYKPLVGTPKFPERIPIIQGTRYLCSNRMLPGGNLSEPRIKQARSSELELYNDLFVAHHPRRQKNEHLDGMRDLKKSMDRLDQVEKCEGDYRITPTINTLAALYPLFLVSDCCADYRALIEP